jgi:hypothetical protein
MADRLLHLCYVLAGRKPTCNAAVAEIMRMPPFVDSSSPGRCLHAATERRNPPAR